MHFNSAGSPVRSASGAWGTAMVLADGRCWAQEDAFGPCLPQKRQRRRFRRLPGHAARDWHGNCTSGSAVNVTEQNLLGVLKW